MTGVSRLNTNSIDNLLGSRSQSNSATPDTASPTASAQRAAAQKSQKDSLTMMLSEIRLSMAQSLLDENFSFSPLESLTASLNNLQAVNEAMVFQANPGSLLSSDSLGQALESLNPAKGLMNAMEQTNLAQRNPELVHTILQSLEPDSANAVSTSPGSILNMLA